MGIHLTGGHGAMHKEKGHGEKRKSALAEMQSIRRRAGQEVEEQEGAGIRIGIYEDGEGS